MGFLKTIKRFRFEKIYPLPPAPYPWYHDSRVFSRRENMIKFSDMPYTRPDIESMKQAFSAATEKVLNAKKD